MAEQTQEGSIVDFLRAYLKRAETLLAKPEVPIGTLAFWSGPIRFQLAKIYGNASPALAGFPDQKIDSRITDPRSELIKRAEQVRRLIQLLEAAPVASNSPLSGHTVFIGHGRSNVWLQLKDFIRERAGLPCDEFNLQPAAGLSTTERLDAMLSQAAFAFVVMTAEEPHADGTIYARPNVIHECGLFQGKLGTRRAIILLEAGCSDFSNIKGLTQIRFPKDDLKPAFEEIRRVLEREKLM